MSQGMPAASRNWKSKVASPPSQPLTGAQPHRVQTSAALSHQVHGNLLQQSKEIKTHSEHSRSLQPPTTYVCHNHQS